MAIALLAGCASAPLETRRVAAEPDAAFAAAGRTLAASWTIASRDAATRRVRTDWFRVESDRTEGLLIDRPWQERVRVAVSVSPADGGAASDVAVHVDAEEKPSAGARAYRFERTTPPAGLAGEVLDAIEKSLERAAAEGESNEVRP